ncbi:MAG: TIGR03086 family metal-binding protein [Firmicutes bacterium]|jgi:uncharacterized protein (TIGR03086 family)|nr:TIGR03086 family metal-binding protein [Bacillota bacterium]
MESEASRQEVLKRYSLVAEDFAHRLANVTPAQLHLPTPCHEWDVSRLITHVIETNFRVGAQVDSSNQHRSADDFVSQWETAKSLITDLLANEATANQMTSGMFGEQSFASLVGRLLCADTLFHTWDLAKATSQDTNLNQDAVEKAFAFLEPLDEAIRRPGGFAPKITSAPDADLQTRFLNFGGRQVQLID